MKRFCVLLFAAVTIFLALAAPSLAFSDVPSSHPYADAIDVLSQQGIITGFNDGTFRPDAPVTRQQFAKMIAKTLDLEITGSESCPFSDVEAQSGVDPFYPSKYVAVCASQGITQGKTSTRFAPGDSITRQQLITMVARAAGLSSPPATYAPPFTPGQFYPYEHYQNAAKAAFAGLLEGLQGLASGLDFLAASSRGECAKLLANLMQGPVEAPTQQIIKYSGSGDQVIDVQKWHGSAVVWIQGNADSNHFAVINYGPGYSGSYTYYDLLVNTTDPYQGMSLIDYWSFGDSEQTTRFEVKAQGGWKIEIRPLGSARTVANGSQISGSTDEVLLVTGNPGKATITGNAASRYFGVIAYYGQSTMYDLLVNETDPYSGTVMLSKPNAKVITVRASDAWTISLAD